LESTSTTDTATGQAAALRETENTPYFECRNRGSASVPWTL
jgi:hypothetical protein